MILEFFSLIFISMRKPFAYGSIDLDRQAIYSRLTLFETEICDNWVTHFDAFIFYYFFFLGLVGLTNN